MPARKKKKVFELQTELNQIIKAAAVKNALIILESKTGCEIATMGDLTEMMKRILESNLLRVHSIDEETAKSGKSGCAQFLEISKSVKDAFDYGGEVLAELYGKDENKLPTIQ